MGSEEDKLKRQRRRKRNFLAKQLRTNPLFKQKKISSKPKVMEEDKFDFKQYLKEEEDGET